ncbi:MAG: hypothetical protein A2017_17215 [Lentisphaerae bacterium GWF2_44_16]|nr:MAG: hypothetical protein A2017_17215 [Lentisphaerae bacterium GWF2_44_16]
MEISFRDEDRLLCVILDGRFDAFAAKEMEEKFLQHWKEQTVCVVLDMANVNYISSAGLRIMTAIHKKLKSASGSIALVSLQEYCLQVLEVTGFAQMFPCYKDLESALSHCREIVKEKKYTENWEKLEIVNSLSGKIHITPGSTEKAVLEVLGDIRALLHAQIVPEDVYSKLFFETEYSIGLGGLGAKLEDYFHIMGEMLTIGGAMAWLPTDGHDTADMLVPHKDSGKIAINTPYNVKFPHTFNEFMLFESSEPGGTSLQSLYREIFKLSAKRRPDYKGAISMVMRAQMTAVLGSGLKKSPVKDFAPPNGKTINHQSNVPDWFKIDSSPLHQDATALICGMGANLLEDLSNYNEDEINRVFYLNPANIAAKTELINNYAVIFKKLPMPEKPMDIETEVAGVLKDGAFVDMRHIFDSSTVSRAFIGINYIQEFTPSIHLQDGLISEFHQHFENPSTKRTLLDSYRRSMKK